MKQAVIARMDDQQRSHLFELWRRGAPFPEIAVAVNGFMQAAARAAGTNDVGGGVKSIPARSRYFQKAEARG